MKLFKINQILLFILGLGLFPGTVPAQESSPQRIISLAPSLTEALCLLGMEEAIVGVTSFCIKPLSMAQRPRVASAVDVNIEKVMMLQPDLIVTTILTDIKDVRKLQALGKRVEIFDQPRDFDHLVEQFLRLGRLSGREQEAVQMINRVRVRLDSLVSNLIEGPRLKAVIQIGANPLFVATDESLMNDMLKRAGYKNIAATWGSGLASREKVLALNPDVVFIVTMGVAGKQERDVWLSYKMLHAARKEAVYVLNSELFCSPSPESFIEAVSLLIRIRNKENEII
ncbi:ABC transporter substrate-binding protein [bacterium]|nr:ABC transporter substrate-binding protein [bacterium]